MTRHLTEADFANPSLNEILDAVPMLQWRKCHACGHVALYRDNTLPACQCRWCQSADTRAMPRENKRLHRTWEIDIRATEGDTNTFIRKVESDDTDMEKENRQLRKDRRDLCILLGRDNSDRTLTEIVQDLLDISERLRARLAALEAVAIMTGGDE